MSPPARTLRMAGALALKGDAAAPEATVLARGAAIAPASAPTLTAPTLTPSAGVSTLTDWPQHDRRRVRVSPRKRMFDFVLAAAVFMALAPVLAAIWCAVRITSPGPGLHWSERVGRRGKIFRMPKFRTMHLSAPNVPREALGDGAAAITAVGRLLRRWSIDELPQLWCILKGDMSFVGPRPLLACDPSQQARADFPEVADVRPGLSGLAQIRGRNLVSPRRKARLDAFYARMRHGGFDLEICARTVAVLLTGRGFV